VGSDEAMGRKDDSSVHSGQGGESADWRLPLIRYIHGSGGIVDRKTRHQALKYNMMDDELYRRTIEGILLKFLDEEAARDGGSAPRALWYSSVG
jgi:hypothetical protein